jgi:hypothetical protein
MTVAPAHSNFEPAATCCAMCGAKFGVLPNWSLDDRAFSCGGNVVRFTKREAAFVDALWRWRLRGGIEGRERFLEIAYADDAEGGPVSLSVVGVHLATIRKKLVPAGWTVTRGYGSPRSSYRLVELPP